MVLDVPMPLLQGQQVDFNPWRELSKTTEGLVQASLALPYNDVLEAY